MLERTNYGMLCDLLKEYEPETFGICTETEEALIKEKLSLSKMNPIELQNMRDLVVAIWGNYTHEEMRSKDGEKTKCKGRMTFDKMSAITYIIDKCKFALASEV